MVVVIGIVLGMVKTNDCFWMCHLVEKGDLLESLLNDGITVVLVVCRCVVCDTRHCQKCFCNSVARLLLGHVCYKQSEVTHPNQPMKSTGQTETTK